MHKGIVEGGRLSDGILQPFRISEQTIKFTLNY